MVTKTTAETVENRQSAVFQIEEATYIYIQRCDDGWDYGLYRAPSFRDPIDGGQLDMPEANILWAAAEICEMYGFPANAYVLMPAAFQEEHFES